MEKNLSLTGLEFLSDFGGKTYDDLSRENKRKISGSKIIFYVIEKQTPSSVKFLIFKRVNTGGLVLAPQEMRHALNQGIPAEFIKKLAEIKEFKTATCNRFVAFYLLGYEENYEGELDKFLNDGMERLASIEDSERLKIRKAFRKSMKLSSDIFDNDAFRKRYDIDDPRPISKAVYDTISVNLAWLSDEQQNALKRKKEKFRSELITLFNDDTFHRSVTSATGHKSNVRTRFKRIKHLIQEILDL